MKKEGIWWCKEILVQWQYKFFLFGRILLIILVHIYYIGIRIYNIHFGL